MPPKKRKRQSRKTTQSQRQSVIVNIGSKPRKKSGRGGLPPPSHMHNLAPTFVTSPQIDYTPLLMAITQQTRSLQPEAPRNPVTPLSSATAEQMAGEAAQRRAGEAAQRRAGPTAANFQPPPSLADERLAQQIQDYDDTLAEEALARKVKSIGAAQPRASSRDVPLAEVVPVSGKPAKNLPRAELLEEDIVLQGLPSTQPSTGFQSSQNPTAEIGPKTPKRQQQQAAEKTDIKQIIDKKLRTRVPLTQEEMSRARLPSSQIGKGRQKALRDAGYPIDIV